MSQRLLLPLYHMARTAFFDRSSHQFLQKILIGWRSTCVRLSRGFFRGLVRFQCHSGCPGPLVPQLAVRSVLGRNLAHLLVVSHVDHCVRQ